MELNELSVIDWNLATKLAGNDRAFAEEIVGLLVKSLPDDIMRLKQLYSSQNYVELSKQLHKLHGAMCYCGVLRLKGVVARIENNLRKDIMADLPALFEQLDFEVNLLLQQPLTACHKATG